MEMDESRVSNSEDYQIDRLSELPDSLLLVILSFLEMRYVVRTSLLSKRWIDLWTTVPRLNFWAEYRSFVWEALSKWKGEKIQECTICFYDDYPHSNDIFDSCLLVPIEKQVEELYVYVANYTSHEYYCAPQRLYSCSSITKLSISYCNLKIGENVDVQWNQLKSLTIEDPNNLSEDAMNRILCGAPLLEELILWSLCITEKLNIQSSSLKTLQICRDDGDPSRTQLMPEGMLRIWAPNLLSLEISACVYGTCLLDVPSLTTAVICFEEEFDLFSGRPIVDLAPLEMFDQVFRSLRHVEKLTLSDLSIQLLLEMKKNHMVVRFSNTKFLKLSVYTSAEAERMLDVLGMFPELMNLVVELNQDRCYTFDREPHAAMVDACNSLASNMTFPNTSLLQLKIIEITWPRFVASIFPMVEILLENAHVLEKLVLRLCADEKIFMLAKKKVLSMPRSSPTAQVIVYVESSSSYQCSYHYVILNQACV